MSPEPGEVSSQILNQEVRAWKEQGGNVIGTMCSYVPEEIIYAAGMLPYRIRGTGCIKRTHSDSLMSSFSCSFARSCLEFALDGTYDFLDGLVAIDTCAQMERLYDNWRFKAGLPFMHLLNLPHKNTASGVAWYRNEISRLKQSMEEAFGINVTENRLVNAIEVYNETRFLLKELYELRKGENPPVKGSESQRIVLAAMSMPRDRFNSLLKASLEEIRSREPGRTPRARLMVIGSALDDPAFIQIIEDQGGLVVTDALCFGSRSFWDPVPVDGDPLLALAGSYLSRPRCPRMMTQHASLLEFIVDMVEAFKVDGILFQKMQYCQLWGGESLFLERKLKELDIPFLSIEREHIVSNAAPIATRVEAFIEMIEGVIE